MLGVSFTAVHASSLSLKADHPEEGAKHLSRRTVRTGEVEGHMNGMRVKGCTNGKSRNHPVFEAIIKSRSYFETRIYFRSP